MANANIHHRDSLAQIYPPDAFASDAAQNGRVTSEVVVGVRILSAPVATGEFEFERASQQIGEAASRAFLAPSRREGDPTGSTHPDPREGYQEFLDRIVAAAQDFGFKAEGTPGRDDPRIKGPRQ
jgi:hypothetical protein